ncbi:hypothetical protein, partial [Escherichia coli]|uniref:hypothetical protein n=1 Tax=Escherichia coli TaxID=562 RepID=UPI00197AEDEE
VVRIIILSCTEIAPPVIWDTLSSNIDFKLLQHFGYRCLTIIKSQLIHVLLHFFVCDSIRGPVGGIDTPI